MAKPAQPMTPAEIRKFLEERGWLVRPAPGAPAGSMVVQQARPAGNLRPEAERKRLQQNLANRPVQGPAPRRPPPSNLRPVAERQALQQNLLSRPVYGPAPAQSPWSSGQAAPASSSSYTGAYQPPLSQIAADKIRQQYAGLSSTPGGGSFMTDTNTGLLQALQALGVQPKPVDQWTTLNKKLKK